MLQQRVAAGSSASVLYANAAPVVSRPSSLLSQRCSSSAAASCSGASTSSSSVLPCKQATRRRRTPPALRVAYQDPPKVGPSRMLNIKFTAKSAFETLAGTEAFDLSSFDDNGLYDTASECPHGNVIGIMRAMEKEPGQCSWPPQVLTAYPDETLQSLIPRLNKVTGLPVIDRVHGKVVGVISRKDIIKVRNAQGPMDTKVSQKMTSPAITIVSSAPVQEAANLMLNSKIRRLPVVDEEGYAVGIVSRSDIFKPLFREAYNLYMEKEVEALQGRTLNFSPASTFAHASAATAASPPSSISSLPSVAAASSAVAAAAAAVVAPFSSASPSSSAVLAQPVIGWRIKYLYDGDCPMCQSLMNVLRRQDNQRGLIQFVNIADESYNPQNNMGITYDEAMETIHAIHPDGSVVQGTEALKELFSTVGLGWAVYLSDLPIVAKLVDLLYQFLSTHRLSLGGALDGIIAAKRMDMSKQGVETCGDVDDSCNAEW